MSGMNAPERAAAFTLDEDAGERKIQYSTDTKTENAGKFTFNKEDHTVGNLLRLQLLRDPNVKFAGYIHPHPLLNYIELRVQTTTSNVAPTEVLSNAIEDLGGETDHLVMQFQEALEKWRRENEDVMGGN
jgi:DNA-directed RNA polymerase II subunit RPB11